MVEPFSMSITIGASEKNVKWQNFLYCRIAVVNMFIDPACVVVNALVIVALRERNKERIPDEGADDCLRVCFIPPVIEFGNLFFDLREQIDGDFFDLFNIVFGQIIFEKQIVNGQLLIR